MFNALQDLFYEDRPIPVNIALMLYVATVVLSVILCFSYAGHMTWSEVALNVVMLFVLAKMAGGRGWARTLIVILGIAGPIFLLWAYHHMQTTMLPLLEQMAQQASQKNPQLGEVLHLSYETSKQKLSSPALLLPMWLDIAFYLAGVLLLMLPTSRAWFADQNP